MAKLTVVVPIYNVEPYLRKCLDSIIGQTFKDMQIILIDDGSPDNCGQICDEYAAKDDRIEVIHKQNAGVSAARNDGIDRATGEWITFIDPDDWIELDFYEKMFSELTRYDRKPDVFLSGGHFTEFTNKTEKIRSEDKDFYFDKKDDLINLKACVIARPQKNTSTLAFPWDKFYLREFMKKNNLYFDTKLHPLEDTLFNLQVFSLCTAASGCRIYGNHYLQNESSVLHRFKQNCIDETLYFLDRMFTYLNCDKNNKIIENILCLRFNMLLVSLCLMFFFHPDNKMGYHEKANAFNFLKQDKNFMYCLQSKKKANLTFKQKCLHSLFSCESFFPLFVGFNLFTIIKKIRNSIAGKVCYK